MEYHSAPGGVYMRWNCRRLGQASILLGALILFAFLLPAGCWPVALGLLFILAGICILKG